MKNNLFITIFASAIMSAQLNAAPFQLEIDGKIFEATPGEQQKITLPDGSSHSIKLIQKEYITFASDLYSYDHKSAYTPTKVDIGGGINQAMLLTPLGTGVLVQEYTMLNPVSLIDLMVQELTKEEVSRGYELKVEERERKLKNGTTIKGKAAITSYQGETWVKEIFASGDVSKGVLIVTFIEEDNRKTDGSFLETFWKSFETKF